MDTLDRKIINTLQRGFPVCDKPFKEVAEQIDTVEDVLITRIRCMLDDCVLTRFGPMFNAEKLGGALSLCAMKVPPDLLDDIASEVNAFAEVAHNYERTHEMNMWFVLATESQEALDATVRQIEHITGFKVYNMPKLREFYVGLHLEV